MNKDHESPEKDRASETGAAVVSDAQREPRKRFSLFRRKKVKPEATALAEPQGEVEPEITAPEISATKIESSETDLSEADILKTDPLKADSLETDPVKTSTATVRSEKNTQEKRGLFRRALSRTGAGIGGLFLGKKAIDASLYEELETQLLVADLGVETCEGVIRELTERVSRRKLSDAEALRGELGDLLEDILSPCEQSLGIQEHVAAGDKGPFVLLVVGVNGVGKTTTIGKLAKRFQQQGLSVMLAAGDTFRAAAVEQLQVWGERNAVPVIAQHTGADSASVIFDAIQSAQARGTDVVIADTAGRLHNKGHLMEELVKVKRVMARLDVAAPHETLLVLDAGTGQNAVAQMRQFGEAVDVSGIALTKLDGTARGGIIFALCQEFGVPIRFVGMGEGVEDLRSFDAKIFVEALLASPDNKL